MRGPTVIAAVSLLLGTFLAPAQEPAAPRKYETGPLTQNDYQAKPPDENRRLVAFTTSDVRYDYRYRVELSPEKAVVTLTEMTFDAVVLPDKSWIRHTLDARLLDHEQGHFDLTYIAVLRQRIQLAKSLRRRAAITATAVTRDEAVMKFTKSMQSYIQEMLDRLLVEQREYDRLTNHGLDRERQAEQRRLHAETIRTLLEEWKPLEK